MKDIKFFVFVSVLIASVFAVHYSNGVVKKFTFNTPERKFIRKLREDSYLKIERIKMLSSQISSRLSSEDFGNSNTLIKKELVKGLQEAVELGIDFSEFAASLNQENNFGGLSKRELQEAKMLFEALVKRFEKLEKLELLK